MSCNNVCKLCKRLTISTAINYDSTTNELIIAIPNGTYFNNEKYCIVVAQAIPTTTPISAEVVITIGTGATRYPLVRRNCIPATACNIKTRCKYSVCVATNNTNGVFRLLGDVGCCGVEVLPSLPVVEATPAVTEALQVSSFSATPTRRTTTTKKEVVENA